MAVEQDLKKETEKWLEKIKQEEDRIELADNSKEVFIKNIDAYISDSIHFLQKGDLIRAFEAVIWAWAYLEIGKDLGIIRKK